MLSARFRSRSSAASPDPASAGDPAADGDEAVVRPARAKGAGDKGADRAVVRAKPRKKDKQKQEKVIRDSFTMPVGDYALIGELKQTWLAAGIEVKKSQLLRAGLHALARLPKAAQKRILTDLEPVKTGRPARRKSAA